jgi:hypothetical protein
MLTREALVYSILINKVKGMKSAALWALKAFHCAKKTLNLICRLNLTVFKEENCKDFEFLSATFPPLGLLFFKSI